MIDLHDKDWVNHVVVAFGIIIGIFILIGLIKSIKDYFTTPELPARIATTTASTNCKTCFNQQTNNVSRTIKVNEQFIIELPESLYPQANLLVIANPQEIIHKGSGVTPAIAGDWAVSFVGTAPGKAEVIVKSAFATASDYHISLTIEK